MAYLGMATRYTQKRRKTPRKRKRTRMRGSGNDRCIFVMMLAKEGLGNQLFTIAAGLIAHNKTGLPLCVIPSSTNPHSTIDYRALFQVPSKVRIVEEANAAPRKVAANSILTIIDAQATAKWSNTNIKYNATSVKNAKMPERLYQNYLAVKSIIPAIKNTLMANEFSKKPEYRQLEEETPTGSAFIHVRRGDYVGTGWSLEADYYLRGLDILNKDKNIKTVWVISNDIEWCKTIDWASNTTAQIKFYDSKSELEVLYKMLLCRAGAVISASTFSAWGAMMGADMNLTSTIVYPLNWLTHDADGDNPLDFPERWVGIPNTAATTTAAA